MYPLQQERCKYGMDKQWMSSRTLEDLNGFLVYDVDEALFLNLHFQ